MIGLYRLLLFVATTILVVNRDAKAFTEEENFDYINKVLALLNDELECRLPTYEGVDELQKSFRELEEVYGDSLNTKLDHDQKLVRETLLDQWDSFQQRMTSAVVIRTAKKRSFLGKVEAYQKGKYGHSICTQLKDVRGPVTDKIFEKNPIVRYIKHLETGYVPEREPEPEAEQNQEEDLDVEKETEVIHTPISEPTQPEANLPNPVDTMPEPVADIVLEDETKEEITPPQYSLDDIPEYDPLADIPVPSALETEEDSTTTTTTTTTTTEATKLETEAEIEELVTEAAPIETTTEVSFAKLYQLGCEYVDDETDDEDLKRLDKVAPSEWHIDPIYGNFIWPDERPGTNDTFNDLGSIKIEWNNFLSDPDAEEVVEQEEKEEEVVTETPEYVPRRLSAKELRRKRKELLDKISGERRSIEQEHLYGWSHAPDRGSPVQKDRWSDLADNNLCKISYNRDYIGKTRPVKALKSLFGKEGSKRALMSRG